MGEALLEEEVFGSGTDPITRAVAAKPSLFERAAGGTILLDKVAEMPASTQGKLLGVLETGELRRLGSPVAIRVDVRVLAATNRDITRAVAEGHFRADLLFRLNGFTLTVPPLRSRTDDIWPLAEHFLELAAGEAATPKPQLSQDVRPLLQSYAWPGNVRELRHNMQRAFTLAQGARIGIEHLQCADGRERELRSPAPSPTGLAPPSRASIPPSLRDAVAERERQILLDALASANHNQTQAAKILGVSRGTLINKMVAYGIPRPRKGE
jgi:DNA-binding NtrC family response regulator